MIAPARLFSRVGLASMLALAACGGGSGGGAAPIPLFEFGFTGTTTNNIDVQVFFLPDTPTTATGTFDGVNMNVTGFPAQVQYTGTWSSCTFGISTTSAVQAPIAASYNGSFKGNDSIELQPVGGGGLPTLTLQRQGVGTRVTGC
jgi:hypothetical protein